MKPFFSFILSPSALRLRKVRILAGLGLVLHGLGHAVFPLRGAGRFANSAPAEVIVDLAWGVAMVAFAAGGFGFMGWYPFSKLWRRAVPVAVGASAVALGAFRQLDLLPGALIDVLVLVAFYRSTSASFGTPPEAVASRWARVAGSAVAVAVVGYLTLSATTRSSHHRWGTTDAELETALPGDSPDRDPAFEVNHAITIDAPPSSVWPWLVQIGQDRGGFYSYDWLENLFGLNIHSAERIHPEWQDRSEGDLVRAAPVDWLGGALGEDVGWRVTHLESERVMVLRWWGAFVLFPLSGDKTRMFVRSKVSDPKIPVWGAAISFATFELPHFIMERRMLIGIKQRVEHRPPEVPPMAPEQRLAIP
jgi:hypothetical protein